MEICRLEHVKKDYRMGEVVSPLKDVSLTVHSGAFLAVEGPSGIGKSTLLYVMGTLLQSDGGSLFFEGKNVAELSDRAKSELRRDKIGFLFQDTNLIQALTLRENLIFAQKLGRKHRVDKERVDLLLEQFGLAERAHFFPYQLSGGQRRRAMAARCLVHRPALILADEPTNDLDEEWSERMIRFFQEETGRGAAVVMVTHNPHWAKQAQQRWRLENGILLQVSRPQ